MLNELALPNQLLCIVKIIYQKLRSSGNLFQVQLVIQNFKQERFLTLARKINKVARKILRVIPRYLNKIMRHYDVAKEVMNKAPVPSFQN